ncbi:MAG: DUF389 domain-containing protein [Allosphingosinicella sp.]
MAFVEWWRDHVGANVDHVAVVAKVHEESTGSSHYVFMALMSAGIAILGLLLSSPAVVIGAMLISPLMGPIMGLGFAIATFDSVQLRRSAGALLLGILLAVGLCAMIVLFSPLKSVTGEIAARTRPNLFDFLVALFSGLAGSYAMIRGRHGTIVGVAIATAIMPPLAVVGFGVATWNTTVLFGSALLFFTNLMTIAVTAAVLARLYGFAGNLSPRQTGLQATLVVVTLLALAVPLGLSLKQIAWEALASREAQEVMAAEFGSEARVDQVELDFDARPLSVQATVFTPHYRPNAERDLGRRLSRLLGRPVEAKIEQFRVGNGPGEAEATQVAAAKGGTADAARARMAERLALIAGVTPDQVLIDRTQRRAVVRASPLAGADLSTFRILEARVAASEPSWDVALIPPPADLPILPTEDKPDRRQAVLATAAWAAQRLHLEIAVSGGRDAEAEKLVQALRAAGASARRAPGRGAEPVLKWLLPGSPGE